MKQTVEIKLADKVFHVKIAENEVENMKSVVSLFNKHYEELRHQHAGGGNHEVQILMSALKSMMELKSAHAATIREETLHKILEAEQKLSLF